MTHLWILLLCGAVAAAQPGPSGRQAIDPAAADRGRKLYLQFCINCHGSRAQGTENGPDLIRSNVVLHDQLGSQLGPALKKSAGHKGDFTKPQIADLSHFLRQRVEETARNRNPVKPPNVLTGNAEAGRAYFNGAGRCNACHSPAGDLQGIAKKYDPVTLQQRFLFPGGRGAKPAQVTVTPASGQLVSGALVRIDDFSVSLRDAAGEYRSFRRGSDLKVEVQDPYAAHHELLDQYSDSDIHNLVAYLATLK